MNTGQTTPDMPDAAALRVAQRGLATNLAHSRTVLAVCEYYQRHSTAGDLAMADLLSYLVDSYRLALSEAARLARLYNLVPADLHMNRGQFNDGRACRTMRARLEFLRSQANGDVVWYTRELQKELPPDVMALWTELLAAAQERQARIEALMQA